MTPLERAQQNYQRASRELAWWRSCGLTERMWTDRLLDALDQLAGAQERERLSHRPCHDAVDWHTLLAHRIAAEGR